MATIYASKKNGNDYEIRMAGSTVRLYTNSVLHTQYNPKYVLTGSIWDLFFLPSYWLENSKSLKVLVLGVGGGACINQYLSYKDTKITAVEYDHEIFKLSKQFFLDKQKGLSLICDNAFSWVESNGSQNANNYDIIIEDLFSAHQGEPIKATSNAPKSWFQNLEKMLNRNGLLILNFPDARSASDFLKGSSKTISSQFKSVFRFCAPACENTIVVLSKKNQSTSILRERIRKDARLPKRLIRYYARKVV